MFKTLARDIVDELYRSAGSGEDIDGEKIKENIEKLLCEIFGDESAKAYLGYVNYNNWRERNNMGSTEDPVMEIFAKFVNWLYVEEENRDR